MNATKKLLILDLDETLFHASLKPLPMSHDFITNSGYYVIMRPHVTQFLAYCFTHFHVAVWTSATLGYATEMVERIFPSSEKLLFLWHRQHCIARFNTVTAEYQYIKDLKKVKRSRGFDLNAILAIDDSPEKLARQYGNLIRVKPFFGIEDKELLYLMAYLSTLKNEDNVRSIEKRAWRTSQKNKC